MKNKWVKKGLIIKPDSNLGWNQSHCMVPTPYNLGSGLIKIFFSGRDASNRSHIGYAIYDLNSLKIEERNENPVLSPGELGCFDDNGVTPSCLLEINGSLHLYYIGWNPGSTVRVHLFGGLAISNDQGKSFSRWSRAPIIERSIVDPFLNTAPWVVHYEDSFRMYYVSGTEWVDKDSPKYNIKFAESNDGKSWIREGRVCINFADEDETALARPYVIFDEGVWKMWFSYKRGNYLIGYAESEDGVNWKRKDTEVNIGLSKAGFDSQMLEYAAVIKHQDSYFMFYNGNNYGFDGIGLAVSE